MSAMIALYRCLLLSAILSSTYVLSDDSAAATAGCTLCADGSAPVEGASLGGTDCALINDSVGMTPAGSADCTSIQLEGYAYCGCPTIPDSYCTMCDYTESGGFVALPSRFEYLVVPGTTDIKCSDAEFVLRNDGILSCDAAQEAAFFCGCSSAERTSPNCFLCGAGTGTENQNATVNDRLLPPLFTKSCAARDREIGTLSECPDENAIAEDAQSLINVTSYCGCHNEPASTTTASSSLQCSLCGDGNPVLNPNAMVMNGTIACRQLQITASFVIDAAYCATLQTETNATCCTAPPTAAPTVAAAALSNETDSATTADDAAPTSNSNETESDGGDSSSRDVETPAPDDSSSSNNSTNLSPGGDTVSASTAGTARFSRRAFANVLVPAVVALMLVGTNLWG